jgi:hypothetical protein
MQRGEFGDPYRARINLAEITDTGSTDLHDGWPDAPTRE